MSELSGPGGSAYAIRVSHSPDIHTTAGKRADLERRLDEAVHAGSASAARSASRTELVGSDNVVHLASDLVLLDVKYERAQDKAMVMAPNRVARRELHVLVDQYRAERDELRRSFIDAAASDVRK